MHVYITDNTRDFTNAEEIQGYMEGKSGKDLVRSTMEWKGRMTTDYLTAELNMDIFEAEEYLEELENDGFCYSREL